jgi:hypothetical protein
MVADNRLRGGKVADSDHRSKLVMNSMSLTMEKGGALACLERVRLETVATCIRGTLAQVSK